MPSSLDGCWDLHPWGRLSAWVWGAGACVPSWQWQGPLSNGASVSGSAPRHAQQWQEAVLAVAAMGKAVACGCGRFGEPLVQAAAMRLTPLLPATPGCHEGAAAGEPLVAPLHAAKGLKEGTQCVCLHGFVIQTAAPGWSQEPGLRRYGHRSVHCFISIAASCQRGRARVCRLHAGCFQTAVWTRVELFLAGLLTWTVWL